jgi:dimethylaniline monooxygenase (N-oxide forming)
MMPAKRVAIIGAGASGLPSIKECLEEGLEPVCFEKTSDIGGLWNFRPCAEENVACCSLATVTNVGKEMMIYSDFPMPADYPNFMPHRLVLEYFNSYAEKFDLRKHIRFNTVVKRVERAEDYESSGRWRVVVENDGQTETLVFDAVMVCTGHHARPKMAKFDGDEMFKGNVLHTHHYREGAAKYTGKRVLVIGMGDSALDAATEISELASQVIQAYRVAKKTRIVL